MPGTQFIIKTHLSHTEPIIPADARVLWSDLDQRVKLA